MHWKPLSIANKNRLNFFTFKNINFAQHLTGWQAQHHLPYKTMRSTLYWDVYGERSTRGALKVHLLCPISKKQEDSRPPGEICTCTHTLHTATDAVNCSGKKTVGVLVREGACPINKSCHWNFRMEETSILKLVNLKVASTKCTRLADNFHTEVMERFSPRSKYWNDWELEGVWEYVSK